MYGRSIITTCSTYPHICNPQGGVKVCTVWGSSLLSPALLQLSLQYLRASRHIGSVGSCLASAPLSSIEPKLWHEHLAMPTRMEPSSEPSYPQEPSHIPRPHQHSPALPHLQAKTIQEGRDTSLSPPSLN